MDRLLAQAAHTTRRKREIYVAPLSVRPVIGIAARPGAGTRALHLWSAATTAMEPDDTRRERERRVARRRRWSSELN
ncbi:MAG TPA: hypothetical protein VE219_04415 [Candidatus Sulfotelmatobacter sp.]|nr:hypothetical protein [Candidatus Sulfotelmatobacter sp.]